MRLLSKDIALTLASLPWIAYPYAASGAGMIDLSTLPGGSAAQLSRFGGHSIANGVNAAGNVVVGISGSTDGERAFIWTQSGMLSLGTLNGGNTSRAYGLNAAGNVVVGESNCGTGCNHAFRWTQAGGMVDLGALTGGSESSAMAVNAAGDVVVGHSEINDGSFTGTRAFRWTQASGMVNLGVLAGGDFSAAWGVNAAGDVVVGDSNSNNGTRAFRWTQPTGMVDLGVLAGGDYSSARGVNAAGDVIVGYSTATEGMRAFRWTQASGMVSLGVLAGGNESAAYGVNAAGDVVVGSSKAADNEYHGFRWTQASGMQTVEQWLADHGVAVSGMNTNIATGVNARGNVVVGQLSNGNAYIARVDDASNAGTHSGNSGMIDVQDFNRTLQASAYAQLLLTRHTDLVLNGLEGSSSNAPLLPKKLQVWVSGDGGRLSHRSDEDGSTTAGEVGLAYGLTPALEARLALGQQYARSNTIYGGKTTFEQIYIAPALRYFVPESKWVLGVSGFYGAGEVDVDRAYSNAGTIVQAHGSPDARTIAARLRADWVRAYSVGPVAMTPYASLTYVRSHLDAYRETGNGFPVQWNSRSETGHLARVGNDGIWSINDHMSLMGRVEVTHRLNGSNDTVTGRIIELNAFGFNAPQPQKSWLRLGLGGEYKFDTSSALRAMVNVTTQADAPSTWLNVTYQKTF